MRHERAGLAQRLAKTMVLAALAALPAQPAAAGGGPENVVVIIDPTDPDSLYVGNHYASARKIPSRNVIYLSQTAPDYVEFLNLQIEALLGEIANRGISGHIDYVVMGSGSAYRVSAPDLLSDPDCVGVSHLSLPSAYMTSLLANLILAGDADEAYGLSSTEPNGYFSSCDSPMAFNSSVGWIDGDPSSAEGAPRYFLAAMLGYTGARGNTPGELIAMIDRSVAADGTLPEGTFYFMKTTDEARSGPRDPLFPEVINCILSHGGQAVQIEAVLPEGQHDCLGILTGWASPAVETADMTIHPGAFCDHLTSWAAHFDQAQQTKVSSWIRNGASGSHGAVEEPCNDGGKFPHPQMHAHYFRGLSLGEAVFRSLQYVPFQTMIYGDPLTQPFATIPSVDVPDAPASVVSGEVTFTPEASTPKPGASLLRVDLFLDGALADSISPGASFTIDTTSLADGAHEIRVVATDDSPVATQGRWISQLETDNYGRSVTLTVEPGAGDLSTNFLIAVSASTRAVDEIRILQNGRVVGALTSPSESLLINAAALGAGPVRLIAEAEFDDGQKSYSEPQLIEIDFGGACCMADGQCRQASEGTCAQLCGGLYAGDGTSCSSVSCATCGTGDFDLNAAVDLWDFAQLQDCFSGPDNPPDNDPPGHQAACLCAFDTDGDEDVDLPDCASFVAKLTGPCPVMPNTAPTAFGFTKQIAGFDPTLIELPASDPDGDVLTYSILTPPSQATIEGGGGTWLVRPDAFATGEDAIVFQVQDPGGLTDAATIVLRYPDAPASSFDVEVQSVGETGVSISYWPPDLTGKTQRLTPFSTSFANDGSMLQLSANDPFALSPFVRWVHDGAYGPDGQAEIIIPLNHNIKAVAAYLPCRSLKVRTNRPGIFVNVFPPDKNGQSGGVAPFDRVYTADEEDVVLIAPGSTGGHPLAHWKLDGSPQGPGSTALIVPQMDTHHLAAALYSGISGDSDEDHDVDFLDFNEFQQCFSGDVNDPGFEPPTPECAALFDIAQPTDGDVDLLDFQEMASAFTGPF
jgi:hypothetical protein